MGLIYLVTRKVYLPVPLVAIVSIVSAITHRTGVAILAGLVFAAMLTLPTLWDSTHELDAAHRAFLGKAARISPYVASLVLSSGALLISQSGVIWI